jgi:4-hydroxybenzoate polyprenyltransferase
MWMAVSLASLVPYVQLSAQVPIDWRPFLAGFFESLVVYTVDHLRDTRKAAATGFVDHRKAKLAARLPVLKALSIFGMFGFMASVAAAPPDRQPTVFLTYGIHLLLCISYARLKPRIPYLKAAYVSLCVVFMAVAAPAAYDPSLLMGFSPVALLRLVLLILSVSFTIENLQDLRDIKEDREAGVVTLPTGLGEEWTARVLTALQMGCIIFQFALAYLAALPLRVDMLLIHVLCILCAVGFRENTRPYLFQVVLEPLYMSPIALLFLRASILGST